MHFEHLDFLPWILLFFVFFAFVSWRQERKFFQWIKDHWFFNRSKKNKLATACYWIGFLLVLLSALDLRGPAKKLKSNVPTEKTIILIDSSASMQVEDVRPNRYRKALFLARHFVKKAVGHKIAIVLFSDIQKKLIPFTSDIDFLLARLGSLEKDAFQRGGSNLSNAINESVQYFKMTAGKKEDIQGNLLIFTDSEETYGDISVDIPDEVSVAFVGIGTEKGGAIPLKDGNGVYRGNKTYNGEVVISRLNKDLIREMGESIKVFSSWIVTSYSLPTKEILQFFKRAHTEKNDVGQVIIKPVLLEYILIPGVLFIILCYLLRIGRTFVMPLLLVTMAIAEAQTGSSDPSLSQLPDIKQDEATRQQEALARKQKIAETLEELKNNKNPLINKLKLAEAYINSDSKLAYSMYKEIFEQRKKRKSLYPYSYLNYGTTALMTGNIKKGILIYSEARQIIEGQKKKINLDQLIRRNTLLAFKEQEKRRQQQKQQKNDNQKKDQQKQGDQKQQQGNQQKNNENQSGKGQQNQQKENSSSQNDTKSGEQEKRGQKTGQNEQEQKQDQQKPKEGKGSEEKKSEKEQQTGEKQRMAEKNKNEGQGKKKKMSMLKPILKQLVNEDRQLQQKLIDTSTHSRKNRTKRKDW
jgi:Ca-activated chloride channel family protein